MKTLDEVIAELEALRKEWGTGNLQVNVYLHKEFSAVQHINVCEVSVLKGGVIPAIEHVVLIEGNKYG